MDLISASRPGKRLFDQVGRGDHRRLVEILGASDGVNACIRTSETWARKGYFVRCCGGGGGGVGSVGGGSTDAFAVHIVQVDVADDACRG